MNTIPPFRKQHSSKNIFLNRVKAYNHAGRFQSEQDASQVDVELRAYLSSSMGFGLLEIDADDDAAARICANMGWKFAAR